MVLLLSSASGSAQESSPRLVLLFPRPDGNFQAEQEREERVLHTASGLDEAGTKQAGDENSWGFKNRGGQVQ